MPTQGKAPKSNKGRRSSRHGARGKYTTQQARTARNKTNGLKRYKRRLEKKEQLRPNRLLNKRLRWIARGGSAVINWLWKEGPGSAFAVEHDIDHRKVAGYSGWLKAREKAAAKEGGAA